MFNTVFGTPIITSPHLVEASFKVRGIPAKNKPNSHRPYYRKVRVVTPLMMMDKINNRIICHPSLVPKIEAAMKEAQIKARNQMAENVRKMTESAYLYGGAGGWIPNPPKYLSDAKS